MNTRRVGSEKEEEACRYLEEKGYEIVTTNYRCRDAEIDIVAGDGRTLVFVEVKYRKNTEYGSGAHAVSVKKIRNFKKNLLLKGGLRSLRPTLKLLPWLLTTAITEIRRKQSGWRPVN